MEFDIQYRCANCIEVHINRFKESKLFCFFLEVVNHTCYFGYNMYFDSRGMQLVDLRTRQWNIGFNSTDTINNIDNTPGTVYVRLIPEAIPALPKDLTNIVNKYV